jgi:hypothetical protein
VFFCGKKSSFGLWVILSFRFPIASKFKEVVCKISSIPNSNKIFIDTDNNYFHLLLFRYWSTFGQLTVMNFRIAFNPLVLEKYGIDGETQLTRSK